MRDGIKANPNLRQRQSMEMRESHLWWLAVFVIMLLALALLAVDSVNLRDTWWVSPELKLALNTSALRISLLLSALVICAYFRQTARRLRRENDELISSLANHASQLEKKNYEVGRLKELSDQLIGLTDIHGALDLVLGMAAEIVDADTASIMLRDKGLDTLGIAASRGLPPDVVSTARVRVGEGIAGLVARDGRAMILNTDDLTGDIAARMTRGESIVSSVVIPIHVGDEVRGVVNTAKLRGGARFTEEELEVLCTLANQASLVIQKMDLLDGMRRQVEILESTVEELREARAQVVQSEKLASIGQLAGGVAHEINNPLQVILGRAELLLADERDDDAARDLHTILEHTTRIADIVSNLLCFSRQNADAEFRLVDVNDVVGKTLKLIAPQASGDNVRIVQILEPGLPGVYANAGQLQQVFTNLSFNAYQAMRDTGGGTLTAITRKADRSVVIEFVDTGPGIPADVQRRLFEPFFTTKPEGEGTGLGLSIAYGIVQSHGGRIEVESAPGRGARFAVTLPSAEHRTRRGSKAA